MRPVHLLPRLSKEDVQGIYEYNKELKSWWRKWEKRVLLIVGGLGGLMWNQLWPLETFLSHVLSFAIGGWVSILAGAVLLLLFLMFFPKQFNSWDPMVKKKASYAVSKGFESWQECWELVRDFEPMDTKTSADWLKRCYEHNLANTPEFQAWARYREMLGYWPRGLAHMKIYVEQKEKEQDVQELKSLEGLVGSFIESAPKEEGEKRERVCSEKVRSRAG